MTGIDVTGLAPAEALLDVASTSRLMDGAAFVLDSPEEPVAVWGDGTRVLWAEGERTLVVAPDGAGKTTLMKNVGLGLMGTIPAVLGLSIRPVDRLLLLAVDRPDQIRRRWRQGVAEGERDELRERLIVHRGPLDFDPLEPGRLAAWTRDAGADAVLIDSLGALVPRLAADEVGSALNIELLRVVEAGTEVMAATHPRKATSDNKRPDALADVYGSRWLVQGSGSVIGLWGEAGDPLVRFRHLKPVADEVGPFMCAIDHDTTWITVADGSDLLGALRAAPSGLTVPAAARVLYGADDRAPCERARRALDRLAQAGQAYRHGGEQLRGAVQAPATYFATPAGGVQEPLE